jgi:Glycosyl hydrolase family 99
LHKALLSLSVFCFIVASGCATRGMHQTLLPNGQAPALSSQLLAVYMPWFGNHTHIDVGYSSQDPSVLRKQIQQARHMGISAFVVDWYGESNPYSDHNFGLMQEAASESHFQVALLYNEAEDADSQATDSAIASLDKAYRDYIGPTAKYRGAYLTYEGRPLIFIFPKGGHPDWNRVREHCANWEAAPLLIYKDEPAANQSNAFAGSYAWVQPGPGGWAPDGSNWGEQYLKSFYQTMQDKHPDKIAIGGAWPGFDDSAAKWGLNRHIRSACGKTFDDTLTLYQKYYDGAKPLPFMLIETWNDYEEGTAIERRSEANCQESRAGAAPAGPQ